jgi:outer membrane biosynthesis protein TonB
MQDQPKRRRLPAQRAHVFFARVASCALIVVLSALTVGTGACVRAKAKTVPEIPPLEMPPPPARDVEPNESEPPPPVSLPQEPARNTPPRPRPAPTREPPRTEAPRPEPPKPDPPIIETPPPQPEEPARPAATLQTTPPTAEAEVERGIRATLSRAANDLNRIDYRVLNAEARTQYDTAKGFIRNAESAIRSKNLLYAKSLADKAAALATQLGGK